MRPARLELKGFTAYREVQVLDFEQLDLFAITGPTGSGKSSLLDAMTYALFGKVARVGVQASQLIAQGLPRLSVLFDFDVDGGDTGSAGPPGARERRARSASNGGGTVRGCRSERAPTECATRIG
jgi:exonuclease SbcC